MPDSQDHSSLLSVSQTSVVNATVEAILPYLFPVLPLVNLAMTLSRPSSNISNPPAEEYLAKVQAERERLLLQPESDLLPILQRYRVKEKAQVEAAAAAKKVKQAAKAAEMEAALFYNQHSASTDFDYWLKAEYWTFDESVALLLGKEPTTVTWAAVKRELEVKSGFMLFEKPKPASEFLLKYERLRNLALRAQAMTSTTKLQPADVIAWAQHSGATEVLPQLMQLLALPLPVIAQNAAISTKNESPGPQAKPEHDQPILKSSALALKKSALMKKYLRVWPTIESDLTHSNKNGLSKAAKATGYGEWHEDAACAWARQKGKIVESVAPPAASMASLPGKTHFFGN